MLRSHSAAYAAIRKMTGSENVTIGIVHNVFWLEAKGDGPAYFHIRCECCQMTALIHLKLRTGMNFFCW